MPTHLLLEGPDIESVLTELRDSHGPDAKIVQAELVRSGGFAGFFARRRYEVTVEVDEQQLAAEAAAPVSSGLDALLSAAEDGDHSLIAVPARELENDQVATVSADRSSAAPQGWHRPVSTEGNAFSDVLDSLTQSLAEQQRDPEPPFEPFAAYGLPRPRVGPVEPAAAAPLDRVDALDLAPAADLLDPFDAFEVSPARPFVPPAVPPVPAVPAAAATPTPMLAPMPTPMPTPGPDATATATAAAAATAPATAAAPAPASGPDLGPTRALLADLGIPARLLSDLDSPEPLLALWDVVATLPQPQEPQLRPSATRGGALVVVVGAWSAARSAVQALLADLGPVPDAVLSVGMTGADLPVGRTVRSHAGAVDLVRTSRQQHDITVLLVDPGLGRHSAARAAELVATVEPQYVLVAADAGADFGASLAALDALDQSGVAVDAIALDGAARSAAPAAVFEVPVPVSWVDGRPATPGAWIGLLMDVLSTRTAAAPRSHRC